MENREKVKNSKKCRNCGRILLEVEELLLQDDKKKIKLNIKCSRCKAMNSLII
jgi:phage FluMu protein Com